MKKKKIRGIKRKIRSLERNLYESTNKFPEKFYSDEYWNIRIPSSKDFIESTTKIKKFCARNLISRLEYLIKSKPHESLNTRAIVLIKPNDMWCSEIIVFKNKEYLQNFLNRNNDYQKWIPLQSSQNIVDSWGLKVDSNLKSIGYNELNHEDGKTTECRFWVIGEI